MNCKVLQLIPAMFVLTLFGVSCKDYKKNSTHQKVSGKSIKAGKKLAVQYCGSCHQLPDPSLLDTKTWETGVLPGMAPRLGIFEYNFHQYPSSIHDPNVGRSYYPSQPVISFEQWQNIIDYFTATSPDSLLPAKKSLPIRMSDKLFKAIQPSFIYPKPATTFVKLEPNHQIITSDVVQQKIFFFNAALQLTDSINITGAVADVVEDSDKYILCNTGILSPNNGKFGSIQSLSVADKSHIDILSDSLMRPVQLTKTDLNKDGKTDFLVCEFGNLKGALSWLENKDTGYVRHVIRAVPGAIHAYINDYNHDGLPDVWALFAQGDEGIFLFTDKGNGDFDTKQVLQFPPSYGSSSFELDDFNKDGFADIVYTCGDNADYSPVLKPYHGIYIFLNDGKNNFTQKYFYPINGCYKAIAKDFDDDGDLDIATISFFADYTHQPEEGFVYLKNEGDFKFQPYSLPEAKYGRWLTMDTGDIDGDGKIDLVLANFSAIPSMIKNEIDWTKQPEFLLLRNIQ
jgi:VCBS repeat protein